MTEDLSAGLDPAVIDQLSDAELAELARATEPLIEFIPRVSPELQAPWHLAPIVEVFESALRRPRKVVISTPPQHGKTKLCQHGLAWAMQRVPGKRSGYVTYETHRAEKISDETQAIATRAGMQFRGSRKSWKTADGSTLFATGIDSALTGEAIDQILVIDDPVKDVVEANSATYRQRADDWMAAVALTRVHPGASVVVVQTRWHPDDLAGRLIARGWEHIELPAIDSQGKALWPQGRPLAWLNAQRAAVGEFVWASLYQCTPRAKGAHVFGDVHLYDPGFAMPGRRVALGADAAYSQKNYSDYSVGVALAEWGGKYYVLEVDRAQIKAPVFRGRLDGLKQRHGITASRWYTSTTEVGLAEMLGIQPIIANADKHARAQKVAAAWNHGDVLLPKAALWLQDFVSEVTAFTGVNDLHDDQVDALAAAYDELANPAPSYSGLPRVHTPRRF